MNYLERMSMPKGKANRAYQKRKSDRRGNLNKNKKYHSYEMVLLFTIGYIGSKGYYTGCRVRSYAHAISLILKNKNKHYQKTEIFIRHIL